MPQGGKRPGAGRKRAIEQEVTPLEVMLKAMRVHYDAGRYSMAAAIAKNAAPYVHASLSAVQLSRGPTPVQLVLVEEIVSPAGASTNGNGDGHAG